MELKRYVMFYNNKIIDTVLDDYIVTNNQLYAYHFGSAEPVVANIKKTSDNILDLVEPCGLWDLNGDLYECTIDDFVFIEKVYADTDFSTKEVLAIYKRQSNGDYKRYEVK